VSLNFLATIKTFSGHYMRHAFLFFLLILTFNCYSQNTFKAIVRDKITNELLPGATVKIGDRVSQTNDSGKIVFYDLPGTEVNIEVTYAGYEIQRLHFLLNDTATHIIFLPPEHNELESVTIVSSTRTNQRIENSPLKVEVLGREEMDEENTIKPGSIASILGDVSGIQVQQSSATSGNSNVRIQGLDGRYTQILRDGMPLFEGFSGGFGILQIPPLDLKQIELIKGSASTLYGGGAIGGLINLISKKPTYDQEAEVTLNETTLKESNANTYLAKRNKHFGYNFFGGYSHQGIVDVNKDGLSDVPKNKAVIVHPRLFFYPGGKSTVSIGYTGTFEDRIGGDMLAVDGKSDALHRYFEKDKMQRHTADLQSQFIINDENHIEVKAALSSFTRAITTNTHYFKGRQTDYFTELSYILSKEKFSWVSGLNITGDDFRILPSGPVLISDFSDNIIGAFSQFTANLKTNTTLEAGLRADHHNTYGNFLLPRIALFHRFDEHWATRWGIGFGYKTPNVLAPQNFDYDIENLEPLSPNISSERSVGYNAEVNYKKEFGDDASFFINQAFFLTRLNDPIVATRLPGGLVHFDNVGSNITSKGFDTYVKADLQHWELYAGYTFTIVDRNYLQQDKFMPLTPKNRMAFVVVYETPSDWRFGLEGSYTGKQYRYDYTKTPGYMFLAAIIAKNIHDKINLVLNCENVLDKRQSRYETLYTGTISDPQFNPLWAPIDGRVINFSVLFNLAKPKE